MPFHLNVYHVSGTLTRDPDLKYTPGGTAICEFGLAVNRVYHVGEGSSREKREETLFLDCEAWGRTAEVINEYCEKGHTVMLESHLKLDQWEDKQTGQKRSKIRVVVDRFHFVSKPQEKTGDEPREPRQQERQERPAFQKRQPPNYGPQTPRDPDLDAPADDDDVPF